MASPLHLKKLQLLKKAFTEDAMQPGQAAEKVGVNYATAKRWTDEKQTLESTAFQPRFAQTY